MKVSLFTLLLALLCSCEPKRPITAEDEAPPRFEIREDTSAYSRAVFILRDTKTNTEYLSFDEAIIKLD
jgi:hypothetical protein